MDDIVERLKWMIEEGGYNDNITDLAQSCAAEIERLRSQINIAHNILGSETMIWLFHGSENWTYSHIESLRDPVHTYWKKYGNVFRGPDEEARRVER